MKITKYIGMGIVLAAIFLIGLISGRVNKQREKVVEKTDTVTVVLVDTLIVYKPQPVKVVEYRTDTITVYIDGEPIYVPVPLNKYTFAGDEYKVEATGYRVELQSIEVYPKTITHTIANEKVITKINNKRFGIGIQAGYGFSNNGVSPYIGVGIHYSVFRF